MQQFFNIKSKKVLQMGASVFADIKIKFIIRLLKFDNYFLGSALKLQAI